MCATVRATDMGALDEGWCGDGFGLNTGSALVLLKPFPCDSWDDMRRLDILEACSALE